MGLFSRKPEPPRPDEPAHRGGCSAHDMRGPRRRTFEEAARDANAHSKRLHGDHNPNGYIEYDPPAREKK